MNAANRSLLDRAEKLLASVLPAHATLTERRGDVLLHVQGRRDRLHAVVALDSVDRLAAFPPTNWKWIVVNNADLAARAEEIEAAAKAVEAGVLVADADGIARARTAPPHPGIFDRRHDGLTAAWSQLSDW